MDLPQTFDSRARRHGGCGVEGRLDVGGDIVTREAVRLILLVEGG